MMKLYIALICALALSIQSAHIAKRQAYEQWIPQQGFRTLGASYDSAPQTNLLKTIIAAPLSQSQSSYSQAPQMQSSGYGQQTTQVITPPQQQSSGYGQQTTQVITPPQQQSSGYGQQTTQVVTPTQQQSSGYGQVVTPVQTVQSSGYAQVVPVQTVQSSGYGQAVPVQTVQSSGYGQAPVQVVAPVHSSYDSYGQTLNTLSPMQLFMAQPAIQQLISTMVQQYHGNQLGAAQEMPNTCSIGFTQPIYESNQVTETYCRCPTGSYGFTCTEGFVNPCVDGSIEFTAADSRVPSNYFLKCSWGIPYLNKCPNGTVRWSQEMHACVTDEAPVQSVQSSYGGYSNYGTQSLGIPKASQGGYSSY